MFDSVSYVEDGAIVFVGWCCCLKGRSVLLICFARLFCLSNWHCYVLPVLFCLRWMLEPLLLVFPGNWVDGGLVPTFFLLDLPIAMLWRQLGTAECYPLLILGIGAFHTLVGWFVLFWRQPLETLLPALHIVPLLRIWLACMDRESVVLFVLYAGTILVPFT